VVERVKSQYPSTADSHYGAVLQQQAKDVLGAMYAQTMSTQAWVCLERVLNLAVWLDMYRPQIIM
jgi:asparagine synthase (glutamine-hydrolysing)